MSTIYQDTHCALKDLLAMASKAEGATLLIPDLHLVDSLIRGWPFGTLLTWKVKADDQGLRRGYGRGYGDSAFY